jgi:hypothetical protein
MTTVKSLAIIALLVGGTSLAFNDLWSSTRACVRARHGVLQRVCKNDRDVCSLAEPIRLAAQAQAPAAMRCEDPSRRQMLSESRVRESPVPLPWWIVHGSENRGWSSADCRSPASALARISREAAGGKVR